MLYRARIRIGRAVSWADVLLLVGLMAFVYALIGVVHEWTSPFRAKTEIDLSLGALLKYSFLSLIRVVAAYGLSLAFTLSYGYWAAKSKRAEPWLISLLDILQSVPVLGFMPGLVLALVRIFPHSNVGLELAAIIMIFTGQGWNMVFSFYTSLKSVPADIKDLCRHFRLSRWDVLKRVEVPFAANGLIWNSMVSMAGGWFFLMVIESFQLGEQDFRLPGIGSYMAVAYEQGNMPAVFSGIVMMFFLIIMVDRVVWAPLVAWSDRFKGDRDSATHARSLVLEWLNRSVLMRNLQEAFDSWRKTRLKAEDERRRQARSVAPPPRISPVVLEVLRWAFVVVGGVVLGFGFRSMLSLLAASELSDWMLNIRDTALTLFRVTATVILGAAWTIPVGVFIGTHPRYFRWLQPLVQIVASFPAPMLFPVLTSIFLRVGMGLETGSVLLMLFASQWYILFNVISGASLIPSDMLEVADVFRVRGFQLWKSIILPAIFPSLLNGLITAAGGAWNACIVSEYLVVKGKILAATGIGASITQAAQRGDYSGLAGGVLVMVLTVVLINRFFWGSLYRMAETRFRLES